MLVSRIPRRPLLVTPHISQPRLFDNHPVRSLLTAFMVQTRRATQLATKDEPKYNPAGVNPPTKGEHARRPLKRARNEHTSDVHTDHGADAGPTKRPRKARKKDDHAILKPSDVPLRVSSAWKVGAHVSAAGGVENAIVNAAHVRCALEVPFLVPMARRTHRANAFALFVKSQRKWSSPPLTDENVASFKARMNEFGYDPTHVLPHGSYLINLANPDE